MAEHHQYHNQDAIKPSIKATLVTGAAGLLLASVQSTLTKANIGALGTLTRYGSTVGTFAAMGGAYEFFKIAAANLREKDDTYNHAIGGFFSGTVAGLRHRSIPIVLGFGAGTSIVLAAFNYTGGHLQGAKSTQVDDYERKEALRANKRRPIQETLDQLGEGRGIYGPGYQERRKEQIKQRYGIDVPSAS